MTVQLKKLQVKKNEVVSTHKKGLQLSTGSHLKDRVPQGKDSATSLVSALSQHLSERGGVLREPPLRISAPYDAEINRHLLVLDSIYGDTWAGDGGSTGV